eukprot:7291858-Lingulodinium_polyedra.AAC.1
MVRTCPSGSSAYTAATGVIPVERLSPRAQLARVACLSRSVISCNGYAPINRPEKWNFPHGI